MAKRTIRKHNLRQLPVAPPRPVDADPMNEALLALRDAWGDFVSSQAQRYAVPCSVVRPDGTTADQVERAEQIAAITKDHVTIDNLVVRHLLATAPPGIREAFLSAERSKV